MTGSDGRRRHRISPSKLLMSKWTAVEPVLKEKHFLVVKVLPPTVPGCPPDRVELQAVHSGRSAEIEGIDLSDACRWHQGWV